MRRKSKRNDQMVCDNNVIKVVLHHTDLDQPKTQVGTQSRTTLDPAWAEVPTHTIWLPKTDLTISIINNL